MGYQLCSHSSGLLEISRQSKDETAGTKYVPSFICIQKGTHMPLTHTQAPHRQAQTLSTAPDPALELCLPDCQIVLCHTQWGTEEEKSGEKKKLFLSLPCVHMFSLSVTITQHGRANRKRSSLTYNQCGVDGTACAYTVECGRRRRCVEAAARAALCYTIGVWGQEAEMIISHNDRLCPHNDDMIRQRRWVRSLLVKQGDTCHKSILTSKSSTE